MNLKLAKRQRRIEARDALWAYERAVRGFANTLWTNAGYGDEQIILGMATREELEAAQKAAYPFADYLPADLRSLVRQPTIDAPFPPDRGSTEIAATALDAISEKLDAALLARFAPEK
jgi:muconolactone delta-isomerase